VTTPVASILIADDHEMVRRGLRATIEQEPDWAVVGEAGDGRTAVELATSLKPGIVILDLGMPELNGLEAARRIRRALPETRILVLTVYEAEHVVQEVLEAGANGYLLKSDAGRELVSAIRALLDDKPYFTSKVARMILRGYLSGKPATTSARPCVETLSAREREVVQLLAEGLSTKQVAMRLGISTATAATHRTKIMKKIDVHSVAELVLYAIRNRIVQP
jgi:DNA-binding NarL/FixJ family response regulator